MAAAGVPSTLRTLERDIAAGLAHTAHLRERLADPVPGEPAAGRSSATWRAADIAGISDGGVGSSHTALRWAARAIDRRLEKLRLAMARQSDPERAEILLVMRAELGTLNWTIEDMTLEPDHQADAETRASRALAFERLDQSLKQLDSATAALATFAWHSR